MQGYQQIKSIFSLSRTIADIRRMKNCRTFSLQSKEKRHILKHGFKLRTTLYLYASWAQVFLIRTILGMKDGTNTLIV